MSNSLASTYGVISVQLLKLGAPDVPLNCRAMFRG
jgi:hypothetical protein